LPTPTSATGELPTAAPPPETEATAVPSNPTGGNTAGGCPNPYTVQRGDWLYQIARKCGVSPQSIVAANPGINPNYVFPGQVLQIPGGGSAPPPSGGQGNPPPPTGGGRTYVVQRGDNLFRIALRFGVSLYALMQANGIANPNFIFVGQVLRIP
jgi:LysM repeat protein